jgi:hypothetical protein
MQASERRTAPMLAPVAVTRARRQRRKPREPKEGHGFGAQRRRRAATRVGMVAHECAGLGGGHCSSSRRSRASTGAGCKPSAEPLVLSLTDDLVSNFGWQVGRHPHIGKGRAGWTRHEMFSFVCVTWQPRTDFVALSGGGVRWRKVGPPSVSSEAGRLFRALGTLLKGLAPTDCPMPNRAGPPFRFGGCSLDPEIREGTHR